jgi:hypothetical protein
MINNSSLTDNLTKERFTNEVQKWKETALVKTNYYSNYDKVTI